MACQIPTACKALVLLAGFCGPRWGEAIALRRRDVNLAECTLKIRRQVISLPGRPPEVVNYTKSDAGMRTVDLPCEVVVALRTHLENDAELGPDGLLWTARKRNGAAGFLRASNFRRDVWLPAVKAVGADLEAVEGLVFHDLRHAAGTIAASTGAPIKDLMQRLGHASESAALRYQHSTQATQRELAARIDALLQLSASAEAATGTDSNVVSLRPKN